VTRGNGCTATGSVTVTAGEPLAATIAQGANEICQGASTTLAVAPSGGGEPYAILWSPGGATTSQISVSPATTTEYTATITDACGGEVVLSRTVIVNPTPVVTAGHAAPACSGSSLQLTGTADSGSVLWSGPLNFSSAELSPVRTGATTAMNGTYTLTSTLGDCVGTATTVVSIVPGASAITVAPAQATVCAGTPVELAASGGQGSGVGTGVVGGSNQINTTDVQSPFYRFWENVRHQYVIRASELAGFSTPITSITFTTADNGGVAFAQNGYTIRMANTTATDATSWVNVPMTTVFGPVSYTAVAGANTHVFSVPFNWDGVSNVVIDLCFENDPTTANTCTISGVPCYTSSAPAIAMATAGFVSSRVWYADDDPVCGIPTPASGILATSAQRPVMTFSYGATLPVTYSWSPANGLNTTAGATVTATPTVTTTYTVTGTLANGCTNSANVTVTIDVTDSDGDGIVDCVDECDQIAGTNGDVCDPGPGFTNGIITNCECVGSPVANYVDVVSKVVLDGAYDAATGRMRDDLRVLGLIPAVQPYGAAPFNHTGTETVAPAVLANADPATAVVDWVLLELRDAASVNVVVKRRAALLLRNGDIRDIDGASPVRFPDVAPGNYRLVVRHRNHMGVITANSYALGTIPTNIDLTSATHPVTHGVAGRKSITGVYAVLAMWGGDANSNQALSYYGSGSDRQFILDVIGSAIPYSVVANAYSAADVNMDGTVSYYGSGPDRQFVLNNIGSAIPYTTFNLPIQ
jgi:hypothetical protein